MRISKFDSPGMTSAARIHPVVLFGRMGSSAWYQPGWVLTASSVRGCLYSVLFENVLITFEASSGCSKALNSSTTEVSVVEAWNFGTVVVVVGATLSFAWTTACS